MRGILRIVWLFLIFGKRDRKHGFRRFRQIVDMGTSVAINLAMSGAVVFATVHGYGRAGVKGAAIAFGIAVAVACALWAYFRKQIQEWEAEGASPGRRWVQPAGHHEFQQDSPATYDTYDVPQGSSYQPPAPEPYSSPPQPPPPEWESERYGRDYGPSP